MLATQIHLKEEKETRTAPEFSHSVKMWLDWINNEAQRTYSRAVVLVGHNVRTFDLRLLIHQGKRHGVNVVDEMSRRSLIFFFIYRHPFSPQEEQRVGLATHAHKDQERSKFPGPRQRVPGGFTARVSPMPIEQTGRGRLTGLHFSASKDSAEPWSSPRTTASASL